MEKMSSIKDLYAIVQLLKQSFTQKTMWVANVLILCFISLSKLQKAYYGLNLYKDMRLKTVH